ncbi:MAG: tetratricopeptide repeat protein, partial [Acidimicrobiales bacterium]
PGRLVPEARRAVARGRAVEPDEAARRFRGSVARKGARLVAAPDDGRRRTTTARPALVDERPAWEPEVWIDDDGDARAEPAVGQSPSPASRRSAPSLPDEVGAEVARAVGRTKAERVQRRLAEAIKAYERDRYADALRTLRPIAQAAPLSATVRELHGLTLYRLGRWTSAIRELEAFHALTGSYDQHPVLADCHRALGHWKAAEAAWEDLRRSSPPPELLAEGRIVMAGALADRGDLAGGIALLEQAKTKERPPPLHHLRVWYALADLYERAGDVPRARALFAAVLESDPALFDTPDRLAALA